MKRVLLTLVCAGVLLPTQVAYGVTMVAPASDTTLTPGATFTARVAPSAGEQITAAAFGMGSLTPVTAAASSTVSGAFEAQLAVPTILVGPAFVFASATLSDGSIAIDFVQVNVEPGAVGRLLIAPLPTLNTVGQVYRLQVRAVFGDGVTRDVTLPERGTTYSSSNEAVLAVHPSGLIQPRTKGNAILTVNNRGQSTSQIVQVNVPDPATTHIPVANPGQDQIVASQTPVTLSGLASIDPDGNPLTYYWEQESGPPALLVTPNAGQTEFISPRVDSTEVLQFSLVVSNNKGASTFPAIVNVTVDPSLSSALSPAPATAASAPALNKK